MMSACPEWIDQLKKVVGQEGILVRVAAVDATHVLVNFGGGKERMGEAIAAAKAGKALLSKDGGIQRVSAKLPKEKTAEVYIAVDRIVSLIRNITEATGSGQAFPIRMPEINAPLAYVTTANGLVGTVDLYVPMELIVEIKNTTMQMLGTMMGGAQQQQPSEPPMMDDTEEQKDEE